MTGSQAAAAQGLLAEAWLALAGQAAAAAPVRFSGWRDGLLASRLPCLPTMTAAVAVSVLAVGRLDSARCGHAPEPVSVDVRHVAVAARSERYAREQNGEPANLFAPLSRFWRTADGWLRTHANYAWHRERLLRVLSCPDDPESVAAAVARWPGEELEDALAAAGALGFAVRDIRPAGRPALRADREGSR